MVKILPGVFNPLVALAAKQAGFKDLYLSGGALSASLGKPDIGLITLEELAQTARAIVAAARLPLLVDADTGYNDISRCVAVLEKAGAAGLHIEDQIFPKRCGHLEGKELVSTEAMCKKIRTACRAKKNRKFLIMARTDARGVEGLEAAIERARAYVQAGAEGLFPEGLTSAEEFKAFAQAFPKTPLLANMTEFGKTPLIDADQFAKMGYAMVIFPVTLLRLAMKAAVEGLREIKTKGTQKDMIKKMQTRKELYKLLNYNPNAR